MIEDYRTKKERRNTLRVEQEQLKELLRDGENVRPYRLEPYYKHFKKSERILGSIIHTFVGNERTEGSRNHRELVETLMEDVENIQDRMQNLGSEDRSLTYGRFAQNCSIFWNDTNIYVPQNLREAEELINNGPKKYFLEMEGGELTEEQKELINNGPETLDSREFTAEIEDSSQKIGIELERSDTEEAEKGNNNLYTLKAEVGFNPQIRPSRQNVYREIVEDAFRIHEQLDSEGYAQRYSKDFARVIWDR